MRSSPDGERSRFAVRLFAPAAVESAWLAAALVRRSRRDLLFAALALFCAGPTLAALPLAQIPDEDSKEEPFEKIDPYTKGERAGLDRAGYISLGPFLFAEGIKTQDIEETLGGIQVLWVETEHFKLGSTLKTYKLEGDAREKRRLEKELERSKPKFDEFKPPRGKLDPWLRLHLYAQRLEDLHADFRARFAIADADFDARKRKPGMLYMGEGPHLGMEMKFTVLLTEKASSLGRFGKRYLDWEVKCYGRALLPGGSMFLCASAEGLRQCGYDLDEALACLVVSEETHCLVDGFRKSCAPPLWFKYGLAHFFSRRIDERFTITAANTTREFGDESWKWEPRVCGLVANGVALPWSEMLAWRKWDDIKSQGHMLAWSRVSWLLSRKDADLRAFLMGVSDSLVPVPEAERAQMIEARTRSSAKAAFGKTIEELDEDWKQFVLKSYPRK